MTPQQILAIVAMLSASAVNADVRVDRADANGDGYVSLYELRAAYYADLEFNRRIEQSFADYDTDGDGLISEAERRAPGVKATEMAPAAKTSPPAAAAVPPTAAAAVAATAAAQTPAPVSVVTPGTKTGVTGSGDRSPDAAPAASAAETSLPNIELLSRSELWIQEIDADNSGGASVKELKASGDGQQWFPPSAFDSADVNDDGDLDPDELEVLMQSMERRRR